MRRIAFITGATAGIGKACAEKLAEAGWDLIINGRRENRLQDLAEQLEKRFNIAVCQLPFDVRDKAAVDKAMLQLGDDWQAIDLLINNAGLALGRDHFQDAQMDDWETMIDTNLKGLLYVTRASLPFLFRSPHSIILNIGSIAGKEVYEKGNVYCATKSAVDAISKAMRIDLLSKGVRVMAIHPGATETEFSQVRFKGDQETARQVYQGLEPLLAADVAELVHYCSSLPPHVCINDLTVTCTRQANSFYLNRSV